MDRTDCFSPSYEDARRRFRAAAESAGARLERYGVDVPGSADGELTIDAAILGDRDPQRAVVVSSGLHGVEGFFGSAIQLAWLAAGGPAPADGRVVLVHGINPYGFQKLRRNNEDNADLNRNFLASADEYRGCPEGYESLDGFLNPPSPPPRFEPFALKALWNILRFGLPALKNAVAGGQYEFPRGLFFGGRGPSRSARIVFEQFEGWIGGARDVVHVDFHSGLGEHGHYKLLLRESADSPEMGWWRETFGADRVETHDDAEGTAYRVSGLMGAGIADRLRDRRFRFAVAEFGTYSVIRVLAALRAENRAHFYCEPGDRVYRRAKTELLECFCPRSDRWRRTVVERGLRIVEQAIGSQR